MALPAPVANAVPKMFARLATYVVKEEYKKGLLVCDKLLKSVPGDADVLQTKCLCLINRERFADVLVVAGERAELGFERAYCLYRLGRLQEAEALLQGAEGELPSQLLAQLLYRKASQPHCA